MMRFSPFIFLCFYLTITCVHAQVKGDVIIPDNTARDQNIILVRWDQESELKWKSENLDRLEFMAVEINVEFEALNERNGFSTFHFDIQGNPRVEALFKIEALESGEEIKLLDKKTGRLIFKIDNALRKHQLSPVFDPSQTIIIIPQGHNVFSIATLYVHDEFSLWRGGIGFNTALDCHPNVACKQDSILQLISMTIRILTALLEIS